MVSMQNNQINLKLSEMISEVLEIEPDQNYYDQLNDFSKLGISSMDFVRIVVMIENEYDFEFTDDDIDQLKFRNVGDLSEYIQKMTSIP